VYVDRRADARRRGGELILVWNRYSERLLIERVGLAGGTPVTMGPVIRGFPFRSIHVAVSPNEIFVGSSPRGITILRKDSFEVFTEEQGAPSNEVWSLAWWKDRLYVALADAFASFDPQTKKFQLIASSLSVEPRNPIDGRGSFFIRELWADETNECLWMSIQDNAAARDRNGLWRYQPASNSFLKITKTQERGHVISSWTDDGLLLKTTVPQRWGHLDPKSGNLNWLTNYAVPHFPNDALFRTERYVKVGNHIISAHGQLFTPDGQEHRAQIDTVWSRLERIGPGFITHFDEKEKVLWYVEPKSRSKSTALESN
jgi:hypothetical protein